MVLKQYNNFNEKLRLFAKCILVIVLTMILWGICSYLLNDYLCNELGFSISEKAIVKKRVFNIKTPFYTSFKMLLLYPFIEELIYRLPISLKRWHIIVAFLSLVSVYVLKLQFLDYRTILFLVLAMVIYFFYPYLEDYIFKYKTRLTYVFLLILSLFFAFDHSGTWLSVLPESHLFLVPFYVLPQFVLAVIACVLRLKNGFLWALGFHLVFNIPFTVNYFLS